MTWTAGRSGTDHCRSTHHSRLTGREAAAVTDWLEQTDLPWHVMRDNPNHGTEILGGMWGARMDTGHEDEFRQSMTKLLNDVMLL